ncbi:MAG: hypothetical protein LBN18_08345 [Dysgonamonadaceae bacterium]|jgi:MFS family permease|nr:hypothetical protein [Dysgonamonadaceae bacterium]
MNYEKTIEFYKNRSFSERLSAATDFIKQTWKVLLKNVLIIGLPLALIMGYALQSYMSALLSVQQGDVSELLSGFAGGFALLIVAVCIISLILPAITGAILIQYDKGELTEETGWRDLQKNIFRLAGKTFKIGILLTLLLILICGLVGGLIFAAGGQDNVALIVLLVLLLVGGLVALAPSLSIIYFPAYYEGLSSWASIRKAIPLGFKNWGYLFVAIIIIGIISGIISNFLGVPNQFYSTTHPGEFTIVGFFLATLAGVGSVLVTPLQVIFMSFQYFAIVERNEGNSLQSQVDEFENM